MKKIKKKQFSFGTKNVRNKIISSSLISTILLSFTGCENVDNKAEFLKDNGVEVTQLIDNSNQYDLYYVDTYDETLIEDANLKNLIMSTGMPPVTCSPEEFKNNSTYKNVTIDDVKSLIKNNKELEEYDKNVLLVGIDNLVKAGFNINTSVLYCNLEGLKVIHFDEVPEDFKGVSNGQFRADIKTMYIPTINFINKYGNGDIKQKDFILCHELLGHGSMGCHDEKDNLFVKYEKSICQLGKEITNFTIVGTFIEEGMADIIAINATGYTKYAGYPLNSYLVYDLMSVCGLSFNDVYNNDIRLIAHKLEEIGIKDSYDTLNNIDSYIYQFLYYAHEPYNDEMYMTAYIIKLYTAYINYLYTNSGKSIEDIEIIVNDSIDNYKKVYYIENHGDPAVAICDDINGIIYVRPSELKIKCKQYMNSLKNTRTK